MDSSIVLIVYNSKDNEHPIALGYNWSEDRIQAIEKATSSQLVRLTVADIDTAQKLIDDPVELSTAMKNIR